MDDNPYVKRQTELIPKLSSFTVAPHTFLMTPSDLKVFQILLLFSIQCDIKENWSYILT